MDNQLRIKTQFVSKVLQSTAEKIRQSQQQTAKDWNLYETGELYKYLVGHFSVGNIEGGGKLDMHYLTYARFLDMSDSRRQLKREGYHLYNRIVYGRLYRSALPTLQYGLTNDIKDQIQKELEKTFTNVECNI